MSTTTPKKIIKRKPGAKHVNQYFTSNTQLAIVAYQKEENDELKKKIYVAEIMPAFDALVENLINVYGFKVMYDDKNDLKSECLEFLYTAVNKFDATKGSKAFSYFNVVAKNWLTIKSKQNAKKVQQYISLDDKENISNSDLEKIESFNFIPSYDERISQEEAMNILITIVNELDKRTKSDNEKAVVTAIRTIISDLENLDFLTKRGILVYLRSLSGLNSKQLSLVLSSLKKSYKEVKKLLLQA